MKIDRRRPVHWLYLLLLFLQGILGLLLRWLSKAATSRGSSAVVLYGHKLNGNLLALYRAMEADARHELRPVFLTMDLAYHRDLKATGIRSQWACGIGCAVLLSRAAALVSDHGLHALQLLHGVYRSAGLLFFDVWHGIPFKGFDADDFRLQHRYDEIWVASDLHRKLYLEKFGFPAERVVVTGYARTDRIVAPEESNAGIRQRLGLPRDGKLILFAPTWAQDIQGRSIYPFGQQEKSFLAALSSLAHRHGATLLLRTHLNSVGSTAPESRDVIVLPSEKYSNTEEILQIGDILICDWSSIAFDYLLLDRPTFFLDVPPPFGKGLALDAGYRFGPVVSDLDQLLTHLGYCLEDPKGYQQRHGSHHCEIKQKVYGQMADGRAAVRCLERLSLHIKSGISR